MDKRRRRWCGVGGRRGAGDGQLDGEWCCSGDVVAELSLLPAARLAEVLGGADKRNESGLALVRDLVRHQSGMS
jgi:hypothetical protein